jgi:DNA modification methylase
MGDLSFPWKGSFEEIYVLGDGWSGRRDEGVLRGSPVVTWESKGRKHPHEKPVWLAAHFIAKHSAKVVIDPTSGTGFALRAAKNLGRRAIGIEIEERYCEIAAKRLAQGVLPLGVPRNGP